MKSFLNRKLVAGATALVLLGGAGGAIAATQSSGSGAQAYINDVAAQLKVSPSALTAAMRAASIDQIKAAVAAGRLTQAQASKLEQRIEKGDGLPFVGHRFGGGGFFGHRFGGGGLHSGLTAAAKYLGISEATLRSDLASGKSLSQIASTTSGKSAAGLKAAIIAAEKTRLAGAVSSGRITSKQEQQRLARLSSRIDSLLTRTSKAGSGSRGPWFGPPVS